jgi:hypothetical protein
MTATTSITSGQGVLVRALACVLRAAGICLLTPIVVLLGLLTLAGLAILGATGLTRSLATSIGRRGDGDAPDVTFYARSAAEAVDGVAARQAA